MSMSSPEEIRPSCSHVFATAGLRLFPEAKLDIGPPTETGFYYDIDLDHKFSAAELDKVPYTLVLGGKEAEARAVSVRSRAKGDEGVLPFSEYSERLKTEIATRALAVKTEKTT